MPEDPCRCKGNGIFIRVQDYYRKILYEPWACAGKGRFWFVQT